MKKIIIGVIFILCAFYSHAQVDTISVNTPQSNVFTIVHFKGGVTGDYSVMLPVRDTLDNKATPIRGAITVRPQDNTLWYSNGVNWLGIVANGNAFIIDSIYVERPIGVKIGTSGAALGKQVIYFIKESGLISGGIPVSTGCRTLLMPPSIYIINFNQYTSLATNLTIDTSHATLNRTDRIVGDTFGIVSLIKGTPSSLGLPPTYNPSSQFSLALIPVPAAAACTPPTSSIKVVYDQAVGVAGGEYDTSRVGAIAVDYNNLDNPYHLTKAAFISTYRDSTQLVFTNTGLQDTVTSTSVLVLPTYLNNRLTNPVQVEFFFGSTSVSNNTVINSSLNVLDTGQYQVAAIPFTAFNFSSQIFNKIVFTFRGYDTSGAAGLYFDWIQIQKGITYFEPNRYVDSTKIIAGNEYYYKGGIAYLAGSVGTVNTAGNGLTDSSGRVILGGTMYKNTTINMAGNQLSLSNAIGGSFATLNLSGLDGYGAFSQTTSGSAFRGSTTSGLPMILTTAPTSTNTVVPILYLERGSSGVGANGIGGSIQFGLHTASSNYVVANTIVSKWTDAIQATRTSEFSITGLNSAVTNNLLTLSGNGQAKLDQYASSGFYVNDSTNYKPLVVNSSGTVYQGNWSGGGGGSTAISALTAGLAGNTLNSGAFAQEWQWNTLAGGTGLKLSSSSTAAASNTQKLFQVALSGVNGTSLQKTYAADFSNTHTGSGFNYGIRTTASGGLRNYGLWSDSSVVIGDTSQWSPYTTNTNNTLSPFVMVRKDWNGSTGFTVENQNSGDRARAYIAVLGSPVTGETSEANNKYGLFQVTSSTRDDTSLYAGISGASLVPANTVVVSSGGGLVGGLILYSDNGPTVVTNNLHYGVPPAIYLSPISNAAGIPLNIPDTNYVGIYTRNPSSLFHIGNGVLSPAYSTIAYGSASGNTGGLALKSGTGYTTKWLLQANTSGTTHDLVVQEGTNSTNKIQVLQGTAGDMFLNQSGGNLQVGSSTTPTYLAEFTKSQNAGTTLAILNPTNGTAAHSTFYLGESASANYSFLRHYSRAFTTSSFGEAGSLALVNAGDGNVNYVTFGAYGHKFWVDNNTGTAFNPIRISQAGNLLFTDNTYDIGADLATRPRTGYFATSLVSPIYRGGTASGNNLTLSSTSNATKGQVNSDNLYVVGTSLSGSSTTSNFFNVTGTMPSTMSGTTYGNLIDITGAGTSNQFNVALRVQYSGYSGAGRASVLSFFNGNTSTGTDLLWTSYGGTPNGNSGFVGFAGGTTTGANTGGFGEAYFGSFNTGLFGKASGDKASATNVGVTGQGYKGTSSIGVGVFGYIGNTTPTLVSAAGLFDNGTSTDPIFLGRDNGTTVFTIADGGNVTVGAANNIVGTATNNNAAAGNIGEEVNAIVSTYTNYATTATYQNITSITLTAGDWDISAFMTYSSNSATITAASNAIFVISTTTASAAGATEGRNIGYVPQAALLGTSFFSESISPYRVSISGSTTYYLNTQATFTLGNPQYVGGLHARRMR